MSNAKDRDKPIPRPAEGEAIDFRAALQATLVQQRYTDQAVLMLRGAVEAESRLRGMDVRAAEVTRRTEELERELPTLVKRVEDARAAAVSAEQRAQDAYGAEVAKVRSALDDEALKLAAQRQDRESQFRELERAYRARQEQLAHETQDAERRLATLKADFAAAIAKNAP